MTEVNPLELSPFIVAIVVPFLIGYWLAGRNSPEKVRKMRCPDPECHMCYTPEEIKENLRLKEGEEVEKK